MLKKFKNNFKKIVFLFFGNFLNFYKIFTNFLKILQVTLQKTLMFMKIIPNFSGHFCKSFSFHQNLPKISHKFSSKFFIKFFKLSLKSHNFCKICTLHKYLFPLNRVSVTGDFTVFAPLIRLNF